MSVQFPVHYNSRVQDSIHPYVQDAIEWTNGRLYRSLVGKITVYPIPEIRLQRTNGGKLLDVGCGWGRWTISASRRGYRVTGVDNEAEAISAAKCVSAQLSAHADFTCADVRYLPFADGSFDVVFSYSVIQHCLNLMRGLLYPKLDAFSDQVELRSSRCRTSMEFAPLINYS